MSPHGMVGGVPMNLPMQAIAGRAAVADRDGALAAAAQSGGALAGAAGEAEGRAPQHRRAHRRGRADRALRDRHRRARVLQAASGAAQRRPVAATSARRAARAPGRVGRGPPLPGVRDDHHRGRGGCARCAGAPAAPRHERPRPRPPRRTPREPRRKSRASSPWCATPTATTCMDSGKSLGASPVINVNAKPGQHRVTLKKGSQTKVISLIVEAGQAHLADRLDEVNAVRPARPKALTRETVRIDSLASGGAGVARLAGGAVAFIAARRAGRARRGGGRQEQEARAGPRAARGRGERRARDAAVPVRGDLRRLLVDAPHDRRAGEGPRGHRRGGDRARGPRRRRCPRCCVHPAPRRSAYRTRARLFVKAKARRGARRVPRAGLARSRGDRRLRGARPAHRAAARRARRRCSSARRATATRRSRAGARAGRWWRSSGAGSSRRRCGPRSTRG